MLVFFSSRARRSSGVARSPPNIRSNTTRGLISIGSGWLAEAQLIVLMYEQRKSPAQLPRWLEWSSVANSIEGNVVSWPILAAMI